MEHLEHNELLLVLGDVGHTAILGILKHDKASKCDCLLKALDDRGGGALCGLLLHL